MKEEFSLMEQRVTELCKEQEAANAALNEKGAADKESFQNATTQPDQTPAFKPFTPATSTSESSGPKGSDKQQDKEQQGEAQKATETGDAKKEEAQKATETGDAKKEEAKKEEAKDPGNDNAAVADDTQADAKSAEAAKEQAE